MPKFFETLTSFQGLAGAGTLTALVLVAIARAALPQRERKLTRTPLVLIVFHMIFWGAAELSGGAPEVARILRLASLFFLLASLGRSGFLVLVHAFVARRLAFQLPRIVEDMIQIGIYIGVSLITLRTAGVEPGSLLATSALLTAVLGLSLQDTLGNMFAGLAIQAERPFEVGDWIQFDDNDRHAGQVIEINWRATRIHTLDQIAIVVPNGVLAKAPIRNLSSPTTVVRQGTFIVAPHDAPPEGVRDLLLQAVLACQGVLQEPAPTIVVDEFDERGIRYWVRYFIKDIEVRDLIRGRVNERLWYALSRAEIAIPPPRREVALHEVSEASRGAALERDVAHRRAALGHVDFLTPLSEEQVQTLAEFSRAVRYASGEPIIVQGEAGDEMFIIDHGHVVVMLDKDGKRTNVAELGEGDFFGEMSLMTGEPRAANVTALTECTLIAVGKPAFQRVIQKNERALEEISGLLAKRHTDLAQKASGVSRDRLTEPDLLLDKIRRFFNRSDPPRRRS